MYKLLGADGKPYLSEMPGAFGGNSKQKIYGRLDCRTALPDFPAAMKNTAYSLPTRKRLWPPDTVHAGIVCGNSTRNIRTIQKNTGANAACDRNAGEQSESIIWKIKGSHHCPLWIRIR